MGRAPCCDKAKVKRGPWSPDEDAALRSYLHTHGTTAGNWIALPHKAGLKRCGKSCRLRWLNYLRPNIKHGNFTEEEDSIIFTLFKTIGSRWSVIASHLPGRTDNDVKNYWNTKLKKKVMAGDPPLINKSSSSSASASLINNLSTLPPLAPLSTIKHEPPHYSSHSLFNSTYSFAELQSPIFPMFTKSNSTDQDSSAASSISVENWSSNNNVDDDDYAFLSELGFDESYTEFLGAYGESSTPFYTSGFDYQSVSYS